jgi:valyl-tRNA synthetase
MVMMSLELNDIVPFHIVDLHPLIRDAYGRQISKMLENVVDPIHVIRGISLEELIEGIKTEILHEKENEPAMNGLEKDFPFGILQCGSDAMRVSLYSFTGAKEQQI